MVAPWDETQLRVVIEFQKGSSGVKRKIDLKHSPQNVPPQLYGRVDPGAWAALMTDCQQLALEHPYNVTASADCCCNNLMGFCMAVVVGFGCCFQGRGENSTGSHCINMPFLFTLFANTGSHA